MTAEFKEINMQDRKPVQPVELWNSGSPNLTRQNLPYYISLFETTALVCNVLAQAQEFQRAHLLLLVALQKRTVLSVSHLFYSMGNTPQTV